MTVLLQNPCTTWIKSRIMSRYMSCRCACMQIFPKYCTWKVNIFPRLTWSTWPSTPLFHTRSDPARSTRLSFDLRTVSSPVLHARIWAVNMQCERELAIFIGVELITLLVSPTKSRFKASSSFLAEITRKVHNNLCHFFMHALTKLLGKLRIHLV